MDRLSLHQASLNRKAETAHSPLHPGTNVDAKDKDGETQLHLASSPVGLEAKGGRLPEQGQQVKEWGLHVRFAHPVVAWVGPKEGERGRGVSLPPLSKRRGALRFPFTCPVSREGG